MLEFQNVSFISGDKAILSGISYKVEKGDFITITGPSGSGKSTFLKLCCHLISPSSGKIIYNNKDLYEHDPIELRRRISYCFQTPYLFGDTVENNMNFPFKIRNLKPDMKRISDLFTEFKLEHDYIKKEVRTLSGGEKQKISLIRTLLFKPEILLLDEVTSALDIDNALIVEGIINSLNRQEVTVLWITHSIEQSRRCGNKLLSFDNGKI